MGKREGSDDGVKDKNEQKNVGDKQAAMQLSAELTRMQLREQEAKEQKTKAAKDKQEKDLDRTDITDATAVSDESERKFLKLGTIQNQLQSQLVTLFGVAQNDPQTASSYPQWAHWLAEKDHKSGHTEAAQLMKEQARKAEQTIADAKGGANSDANSDTNASDNK